MKIFLLKKKWSFLHFQEHILSVFSDRNPETRINNIIAFLIIVRFEVDPKVRWLKANVNQSGFYRVNYDDGLWNEIIGQLQLNHEVFSAADRASLIDDIFTLCRAGVLNVTAPLELSKYLYKERDFVPWATALEHFENWSKFLSESSPYKLFLEYTKNLLFPISRFVGWDDQGTHLEKYVSMIYLLL